MSEDTTDEVNGRELLLRAARDVFYEDGYQKASMRNIGKRAGTSQTAIYYYFTDKEDVLFTLIDDFTDRFSSRLLSAMAGAGGPQKQLKSLISAHLETVVTDRRDLKILSQDKNHLPEMQLRLIRSKEKTVLTLYRACLDEWRKCGGLKGVDTTVAAFTIIGAINWLYQWYVPEGGITWDTVKGSMLQHLLHGLGVPSAGPSIHSEMTLAMAGQGD